MTITANGPQFNINKEDVNLLRKLNFVDFKKEGKSATICLTEENPNEVKYENGCVGAIDLQCEVGLRLRRFPEDCSPYEAKSLLYLLEISKAKFEEFLCSEDGRYTRDCFEKDRQIDSRCKYDRFSLHYSSD